MPLKNCFVHGEYQVKFNIMFFSAVVLESKLGPGCLILRLQITHSNIHKHPVQHLRMSGQPVAEAAIYTTHTTNTRVRHLCPQQDLNL